MRDRWVVEGHGRVGIAEEFVGQGAETATKAVSRESYAGVTLPFTVTDLTNQYPSNGYRSSTSFIFSMLL
ncbi:MAG: hypothetical protein WCK70_01960 [Chloroflexales bacterium]